jgi:hypothetical protein
VQANCKADHLSGALCESINDDDMSMLDMDQGMNLETANLADCMVSAMWPGDLSQSSLCQHPAGFGLDTQRSVSQEGSVADPRDAGSQ